MELDQPFIEQIRACKELNDRAMHSHDPADHRAAEHASYMLVLRLNFAIDDHEERSARRERQRIAAERARLEG